jgi:hypothetical protein
VNVLRDCIFVARAILLAALGCGCEFIGHAFIKAGVLCFRVGNGWLEPADKLLECAASIEIVEGE